MCACLSHPLNYACMNNYNKVQLLFEGTFFVLAKSAATIQVNMV